MFMHGGLLHLGGNMLFLWVFGNNVEDAMGRVKFVFFYLLGGFAAMALQIAVDPSATVPSVGASGAVAAVLGGYLLLYPRARVLTLIFLVVFFTFIEIPAMWFLLIWFGEQLLFGYFNQVDPTGGGGGVAYFAHIGGFLFGVLTVRLLATQIQPRLPAALPRLLMRGAVLGAALVFIVALLALTVHAAATGGTDILTVVSAVVLALFAVGIVGALLHPPER